MKKLIIVLLIFSQNIFSQNHIYTKLGFEPTFLSTIGFQRDMEIEILDREIGVYGELGIPLFTLGEGNIDFKTGTKFLIWNYKRFGIKNDINLSIGHLNNDFLESTRIAVGYRLDPGLYFNTWGINLVAEYEKILASYIEPSDYYKDTFYSEARGGWYRTPGGTFQFGLKGYKDIKDFTISAEAKVPFTESFKLYFLPIHVHLGIGYYF